MNVRIYRRRSDDDQSGYSPQAQEARCREWCERQQYTIVGSYFDDDISGARESRPDFQRLIADACTDPGSLIVVDKYDRLARDTEVLLRTIYKVLKPRGVKVYSASEAIDPYTPIGKMTLTVSGGVSTYHNDNLATEVKKGLWGKFQSGAWVGPLPYGYRAHYDRTPSGERIRGTGKAVQNDDAPAARLIFELYSTGNYSDLSLAEEMNRRNYTADNRGRRVPFQRDTIGNILTNKFYMGIVTYTEYDGPWEKGIPRTVLTVHERQGTHEPLIGRELWERVAAIRAERARNLGGRVSYRTGDGLLMDLGYCARCGAVLHWNKAQRRQGYYWCSTRRKFGESACGAPLMPARLADPLVKEVLRRLTIPPTLRDAVIAVVQKRLAQPAGAQAATVAQLQARVQRVRDLYELGDMDRAEYLKKRGDLDRQIAKYEIPTSRELDVPQAITLLSDMATLIEAPEADKVRALVRQIVAAVWIEKNDAGEIAVKAIKPTPSYTLLLPAVADLSSMVTLTGLEAAADTATPHQSPPVMFWSAFKSQLEGRPWNTA